MLRHLLPILLAGFGFAAAQEAAVEEMPSVDIVADFEPVELPPESYLNNSVSEPINVVCPFKGEIDYNPGEVSCGFIEVPENRNDPDSRTIRLLYTKISAKAGLEDWEPEEDEEDLTVRDDPVVYLTGGPGAAVRAYVERFLEHDLVKTRDLYVLQQRGIAESGAFCPFYGSIRPELIRSKTTLEQELESAERMKACLLAAKARGVDITAYNTVENARDVQALRIALGFDEWNVWGISYGSHLGQMLTQVDPDGIRALVLDAIVPNDLKDLGRIGRWIARDMRLVFERCEKSPVSHCEDLEERLKAAAARPAIRVEAADTEILPAGEIYLPQALAGFAAFTMMYEQDEHPAIPAVMDRLLGIFEEERTELLAPLTAANTNTFDIALGMSAAIRCNDGYMMTSAEVAEEDIAEQPLYAGAITTAEGTRAIAQACVDAGAAPRDRADYQLVQSSIPTLIVNGAWDPVTPLPLARQIVPGFSNSRYVEVPYAGHGPTRSMSECSGQVLTDFYDDPSQDLSKLDMECFEKGVEAPEFMEYKLTDATLKIVGLAVTKVTEKLAAPGMAGGLSALVLASGLFLLPAGFLARRMSFGRASDLAVGGLVPRVLALGTILSTVIGCALIGTGAALAFETSETSLVAGFAQPAGLGGWLLLAGGLLGVVTIVSTVMARAKGPVRIGTLVGFPLIGAAGIAFAVLAAQWDLLPF